MSEGQMIRTTFEFRYLALFLGLQFVLIATPAYSAEDCSIIDDAAARLACFDRNFPRQTTPPTPAEEPDTDMEDPEVDLADDAAVPGATDDPVLEEMKPEEEITVVKPEPVSEPEAVTDVTTPSTPKTDKPRKGFFKFLGRKKEEIVATVVDLLSNDKQRMVFQLDNQQIWIQESPRNLPISKGDRVTIREGTMGGYILRTENGVSTRVSMFEPE